MNGINILEELFDKNVVAALTVFLENSGQHFSLTQIADLSKVKTPTVMRIIQKLVKQKFVEIVPIGKSKFYRLAKGEQTEFLLKWIRDSENSE